MIYPHNYKTAVLLDHSHKFLQSSEEPFEFDTVNKSKTSYIPLAPISKSFWACSIEAALEFCRIIYDIFGRKKLISFIASGVETHRLTGWNEYEQDLDHIQKVFGSLGLPRKTGKTEADPAIHYGLHAAIDQLLTPTDKQKQMRYSLREDADTLENNGRVVCITMAKNDNAVDDLIHSFAEALEARNREAVISDDMIAINHCELVIVVTHAVNSSCKVSQRKMYEVTPSLSASVVVTESGRKLANKMVSLAVSFFNLVITSVTGIPMKEEQNANSSANYDVELLHSSEAHTEMLTELAEGSKAPSQEIEGVDAVTLKWCTPKSSSNIDMHWCVGTYPISPVDANSRPSLCLTNFLLSGRSVMLEQPRKSGNKILSHMLTSHGGQIYIHLLSTGKSMLDEPPSISEGVGGRVTDYRIQAFGELIKDHLLVPISNQTTSDPIAQAEAKLERATRLWPLTIGETMIFNLQSHIEPLLKIIVQEHLTEGNIAECRKVLFQLMSLEESNLLGTYSTHKGKKKEEHSKQMWTELEELVQSYSDISPEHAKIVELLNDCKPNHSEHVSVLRKKKHLSESTDMSASDTGDQSADEKRSGYDSPVSTKKTKFSGSPFSFKAGQSVLALWTNRQNAFNSKKHAEFAGRLGSVNNKAILYRKLNEGVMEVVDDSTPLAKHCPDH